MSVSTEKFYRHLYGGQSGILVLFSGERMPAGELDKGSTRTRYFDYPARIADALAYAVEESAASREVWHCAHLLSKGRRVKANAAPVLTLWADLDCAEIPNGLLKPTAVVESSPRHFHCYWRLSEEIGAELAENLNMRLAHATGADPSGFDLTQLLRVPGTPNRKYPDSPIVKVLQLDGGRSYSPRDLDEALPEIEAKRVPRSRDASDEPPVVLDEQALRVWRAEDPKLKEDGTVNRSSTLVKIGRVLYDAGCNRPVIEAALEERGRALGWNKYTNRRDAAQCYAGIVDELEKSGRNRKARITVGGDRPSEGDADTSEEKEGRRNQADRLIGYALEDVQELFVDQHGAPHALVDDDPVLLTSRCYSRLRRLMWQQEGRSVSSEYLKMAAGTLSAHAEFSGEHRELYTRAAWHEGVLYYELRPGKVVRVGPDGWTFEAKPPVLFRRYVNLKALPDPEAGGSLDMLDELVNLKSERDWRLFTAYLVTLPLEHVGRPIFNACGAMGSGKTTIGRVLKRTWDPTAPETVRLDPRDFLQKAMHAYIVMLDNQNTLPEWAADTLCRFVTGEADSKRRLYTDDGDVIIELRRAVILNGINVPTERGDVLDRSLVIELERIPDGDRKTEEQNWELFTRTHSRLLGTLFNVLAKAIALKPSFKLSRRPRLADWGEYAACVYEVMGWGAETFLKDWDEVVQVQNQATLDGSPVAQAIIKLMEEHEECSLTSSKMHALLKEIAEAQGVDIARDKAWPKSARWLWRRIKDVLTLLAAVGIEASRDDTEKASVITFRNLSRNDASNSSIQITGVDRGIHAGISAVSDSSSNSSRTSIPRYDSSPNPADSAAPGDTGDRNGASSEEARTARSEPEKRILRLVEQGMSESWARREVLAGDHLRDCACELCL
jgi:hypothetical protein